MFVNLFRSGLSGINFAASNIGAMPSATVLHFKMKIRENSNVDTVLSIRILEYQNSDRLIRWVLAKLQCFHAVCEISQALKCASQSDQSQPW